MIALFKQGTASDGAIADSWRLLAEPGGHPEAHAIEMSWRSLPTWVVLLTMALCLVEPGPRRRDLDSIPPGSPARAVFESLGVRWRAAAPPAPGDRTALGFGPTGDVGAQPQLDRALDDLAAGRSDRAIRRLRRALEAQPKSSPTAKALAAALVSRGLDESEGRPADLVEALDRIGPEPTDLASLFNRALALEGLYCYRMAARTWELYLEADPDSDWGGVAIDRLARVRETVAVLDRGPADEDGPGAPADADSGSAPDPGPTDAVAALREGLAALAEYRLDRAAAELRRGIAGFELAGDPRRWEAEGGLAQVDAQQGRYEVAEERALRVLEAARASGDRALEDQSLRTLSHLNLGRLHLQSAFDFAMRRLELGRETGQPGIEASAEFTLSRVLDEMGVPDEAWVHRLASLRTLAVMRRGDDLALTLHNSSFALARQGRYFAATDFVSERLAIDRAAGTPLGIAESLSMRASFLTEAGERKAAERDVAEAMAWLDAIPDRSVREYLAARLGVVHGLLLAVTEPRLAVEAFSRSLDALGRTAGIYGRPELLLERAKALRRLGRLDEAGGDLAEAVAQVARQRSEIARPLFRVTFYDLQADLVDEVVGLEVARGRPAEAFRLAESMKGVLLREVLGAGRTSKRAVHVPDPGWRPVLEPDEVLVSYWSLQSETLVWVVEPGEAPTLHRSPVGRAALEARVARLARLAGTGSSADREARELYRILLAPAEGALFEARRLVVVPDRATSGVPWALVMRAGTAELPLDRVTVRLLPSAVPVEGAQRPASRALDSSRLLAVGDPTPVRGAQPLASAREEILEAARRSERSVVLVGAEATRTRVRRELPKADVVWIATHFTTGSMPWSTRIALAPVDGVEDDGLVVGEVAELDLRKARLVLLNGCATGREGKLSLEGTYAAAGAFLAAGAGEVIFTLWPVDDRVAAAFASELFDRLERGERTDEAVRAAQEALADSTDGALRTRDWAAFEIISMGVPPAARPSNPRGGDER